MSALRIGLRRASAGGLHVDLDGPDNATTVTLTGVAEFQLGDALRGVDQALGLGNPGPCERWIAGDQS